MASMQFSRIELLNHIFPELTPTELQVLDAAAQEQYYAPGALLCREGEIGRRLFIIAEGEAEIFINADENQMILVKNVGPTDYFGEMALINDAPRAATVRASTRCKTLEINRDAFITTIDQNPALLRAIVRQISNHLRNNDRIIIRELRKKNKALNVAYNTLSSQEKLRTDFIATLSHELRTPLTSAQGFLHLINRGAMQGEAQTVALDTVTRNVEKMVDLINNLLVLYEMHLLSLEYSNIDLVELVREAIREARRAIDAPSNPVEFVQDVQMPTIRGDRNGLLLAVRSLVENAFKFGQENGLVVINLYLADENTVGLDVIDQGIGIPLEAQPHIFEPFYRVEGTGPDRLYSGLGVGLAISKFVVEQHKGMLAVESEPGEGSTFTIRLPLAAAVEAL
jgi:signal transduction histidine kinase